LSSTQAHDDDVLIRVRGLRRVFSKGDNQVIALDHIDLDVRRGEFVSVMGPSGSGKSTFMHLLGGLDRPDGGTYTLAGQAISGLDDRDLSRIRNRRIGFVFQTFNLLGDSTAAENIALPLVYSGVPRSVRAECGRVSATAMGIGSRLNHRPSELSGGQVQRVAIARALANGPELILADEPTGNLDTHTGEEIMSIFARLHKQGSTIIMVTHDERLARYGDRIIRLVDGHVTSDERIPDSERVRPAEEHQHIEIARPPAKELTHRLDWFDLIRMGIREGLLRHLGRTALTMLGVMFGVAAVIAMSSISEGAKRKAVQQIEAMGARTVRVQARKIEGDELMRARTKGVQGLSLADADAIQSVCPAVVSLARIKRVYADVMVGQKRLTATVLATTPEYPDVTNFHHARGTFITAEDVDNALPRCVIGPAIARQAFGNNDPIGQRILIGQTSYRVVGVMESKTAGLAEMTSVSTRELDSHIYIPLSSAMLRVKRDPDAPELDEIAVLVRDAETVGDTGKLIRRILIRRHRAVEDFSLTVPEEILEARKQTQFIFNVVMISIAGISLLVGGIGIMNIMLANVTERTREIGIRRAVGAGEGEIRKQFLVEAVCISLAGGVLGILLGFIFGGGISLFADFPTAFSIPAILLAFVVSVAVGVIFGFYPAYKAARLDPIQALRYE